MWNLSDNMKIIVNLLIGIPACLFFGALIISIAINDSGMAILLGLCGMLLLGRYIEIKEN